MRGSSTRCQTRYAINVRRMLIRVTVIFPLLGVSPLIVLLLDYLVIAPIPRLRHAFGG